MDHETNEKGELSMRRLVLAAALTSMALLFVAGPVGARPARVPGRTHAVPVAPSSEGSVHNGTIAIGSSWTVVYYPWLDTDDPFCEVFTFGADHVFTGDSGDNGHWSGNLKMVFTGNGDFFSSGNVYKAKLARSGFFSGSFVGTVSLLGAEFGPFVLSSGAASGC
jgi:hypothetical protein